jgi:hypothetical protein
VVNPTRCLVRGEIYVYEFLLEGCAGVLGMPNYDAMILYYIDMVRTPTNRERSGKEEVQVVDNNV